MEFRLGLRNNQHEVSLISTGDPRRTQLGTAYPNDEDKRSRVMNHWGQSAQSPRKPEAATVNIPLSQRAQTILSYRLPDEQRAIVNGQQRPMAESRKDQQPGLKARMHLDTDTTIEVESRSRGAGSQYSAIPATRVKAP